MSETRRPFVLITGLSGAGRATALHALEDFGYDRLVQTMRGAGYRFSARPEV